VADVGDEQAELVTTETRQIAGLAHREPGDGIAAADGFAQALRYGQQQLIAHSVTERVVDPLELVEV